MAEKKPQGFGYLTKFDPDRMKEIARQGGNAVQEKGTGHKWTPEEARTRGAAGGRASQAKRKGKG